MSDRPFFSMGPYKSRFAIGATSTFNFVRAVGIGIETALSTPATASFAARGSSRNSCACAFSSASHFSVVGEAIDVNADPVWGSIAGAVFTIYRGGTLDLNNALRFTDPNADPMTFALVSGSLPSGVTLDGNTGLFSATAGATLGQSGDLVVSADDGSVSTVHVLTLSTDVVGSFVVPYMATAFPLEGTVPSGQTIRSSDDANLRASILSTWPDGSAKVVVVAGETLMTNGVNKTITLRNGADPGGSHLTPARIQAIITNSNAIQANFGGGAQTITNTQLGTPEFTWWANPSHICCRYRLASNVGALEAVIDIHAFRAGVSNRAFVEITIENAKVNSASPVATRPGNATYSGATISVNGLSLSLGNGANSSTALNGVHQEFKAWYVSTWVGGDPSVEVTHDTASMQAHPMMHGLWKTTNQNLQTLYESSAYVPWAYLSLGNPSQGSTGDAAYIGSFTKWDTQYLQSGNKYVRRASIAKALEALSFNINFRDTSTGLVPTFDQVGYKDIQDGAWPGSGGPAWEHAHSPAVGLMAFFCRPSPCFIEIAQKAALWQRTYGNNDPSIPTLLGPSYQVRGKAWTVRAWNHAVFVTPDSSAWKTPTRDRIYSALLSFDLYKNEPKNKLGFVWPLSDTNMSDHDTGVLGYQFAMFENHYLDVELHKGANSKILSGAQHTKYVEIADWACAQPIRWVNEATAGEWRAIARYRTTMGDGPVNTGLSTYVVQGDGTYNQWWDWWYTDAPPTLAGPWLSIGWAPTTWASAVEQEERNGAYYDTYWWAAFCAGVERNLTGSGNAWAKVMANVTNIDSGASPWSSQFNSDPRWGFYPRTIPPATNSYYTSFAASENPLSESGKWVNGGTTGLAWKNVQTSGGNAFASAFVSTYDDSIAHLSTSVIDFLPTQYVQGTVHREADFTHEPDDTYSQEIELLLRFQITANNARGYEVIVSRDDWIVIVRWNGAFQSFQEIASTGGPISPIVNNGDVVRAEFGSDNIIRVYINGTLKLTGPVDNTFTDGQPGLGFWPKAAANYLLGFGWKDWQAGNL